MDKVCVKCYGDKVWLFDDTNESLVWNDKTIENQHWKTCLNLMHSYE